VQLHDIFLQKFHGTLEGVAGSLHTFQDMVFIVVGHHWYHFSYLEQRRLLLLKEQRGQGRDNNNNRAGDFCHRKEPRKWKRHVRDSLMSLGVKDVKR
jgi:hypothetical protein